MKREYMKPEIEKISFCYRDQVVAASGGENGGTSDSTNPSFGQWYGQSSYGGSCSYYAFEAIGARLCDIL